MAHEKLIAFLENEARVLRERIAGLASRDIPSGVRTGEGSPTRLEELAAADRAKLAEVEEHLDALRAADRAGG